MSDKANDPNYIKNPATGRWVKKDGPVGKKILAGTLTASDAPAKKGGKKGGKKASGTGKKRTPSAYILWCKDNRERVKTENPEAKFGEVSKLLGAEWKQTSAADKAPYEEQAASLKEANQ
jgi:hypothetical protein